MSENLWQISVFNDLINFLKNGNDKFIILSLVLPNTKQEISSCIKKFIKRKAKIFPNIIFLYYTIHTEDFKKISFISDNLQSYPKMCHIYNITDMLLEIEGIDCIDVIDDSFSQVEKYYIDDLKNNANNTKISDRSSGSIDSSNNNKQSFSQNNEITNMQAEQRKMLKKLEFLKQSGDQYTIDFFEECRKRKKEEEKLKKKKNKEK